MVKPVTLACGHSGCQNCLAQLIAIQTAPECPLCKTQVPSSTQLNVNIALADITANLDIECTNNGCQWQGTLEEHSQHSSSCGKLSVQCKNRGCNEVMLREEMTVHISQCVKQNVPCQDCGKSVTRDSMQEHVDHFCSHKRISCPLSCGSSLPRFVLNKISYSICLCFDSTFHGIK